MQEFTFNNKVLAIGSSPLIDERNNQFGTIRSDRGLVIRIYDNDDKVLYLAQAQAPKKFLMFSGPVESMQICNSENKTIGTINKKSAFLKYSFRYSKENGSTIEIKQENVKASKYSGSDSSGRNILEAEQRKDKWVFKVDQTILPVGEALCLFVGVLAISYFISQSKANVRSVESNL